MNILRRNIKHYNYSLNINNTFFVFFEINVKIYTKMLPIKNIIKSGSDDFTIATTTV